LGVASLTGVVVARLCFEELEAHREIDASRTGGSLRGKCSRSFALLGDHDGLSSYHGGLGGFHEGLTLGSTIVSVGDVVEDFLLG